MSTLAMIAPLAALPGAPPMMSAGSRAQLRPAPLPGALRAPKGRGRPAASQAVRASYEDAYKEIRERRAAKRRARLADAGGATQEGAAATGGSIPAQTGDMVELRYVITDIASGQVVDSSAISARGGERLVKIQLGTDAGFQPKHGLALAYNDVVTGLTVGEAARLEVRANGNGLFRSYDIYSPSEKEGDRIGSLTQDECRNEWAGKPCRVEVEVVSITPPRGREPGMGRRAYASQLPGGGQRPGGSGGSVDLTQR